MATAASRRARLLPRTRLPPPVWTHECEPSLCHCTDDHHRHDHGHDRHRRRSIAAVFEMIDADGSGHICEEELGMLIRKGLNMATATDEEVSALFAALDTDGNGEIDYDEWWSWYR